MVYNAIEQLVRYGLTKQLIAQEDAVYTRNRLLEIMGLPGKKDTAAEPAGLPLHKLLALLTDDACQRNILVDTQGNRDLFDTRLMGALTPPPSVVTARFMQNYAVSPEQATDQFYAFSQDVNYIRTDCIARDIRWQTDTAYGAMDISINMSKPEKDPRDIAAAKSTPAQGYPQCLLCAEAEGYAGRADFPARQNHRIIPLTLRGEAWGLQYSPYVYYNQHCIVLNKRHVPMVIEPRTFDLLFAFLKQFPHFFIGSNADLPIVGGSILSHEHFQGGNYLMPMAKAPVEQPVTLPGYPGIDAGIVQWPLSVLRLTGENPKALSAAAARVLACWRGYSDETTGILARTDGVPHNTITPIARFREGRYELDLVLRNNRTSAEHPLGIFHPHAEYHHIKKENIGLIEVMGMAILPARLRGELQTLSTAIRAGKPCPIPMHAAWVDEITSKYRAQGTPLATMSEAQLEIILQTEVGRVFCRVLENCGVFARTAGGKEAFLRFLQAV